MLTKYFFPCVAAAALFLACTASTRTDNTAVKASAETKMPEATVNYGPLDTATFAAGCFWCVGAIFEDLKGVQDAIYGYAGGTTTDPTYESVTSETTGHAETVQVFYDPKMISYQKLLEVYFYSQDPTQVNGQGPDHGDSYRSVIFYHNAEQQQLATAYKQQLDASGKYNRPIAVTIEPLKNFYRAEEYHQKYEKKNPNNGYIQGVSVPRLKRMQKQFPDLIKKSEH